MKEISIVRNNLMTREGYTGYCGAYMDCSTGMPRTTWNPKLGQFTCTCGWVSAYPSDFITRYRKKWDK